MKNPATRIRLTALCAILLLVTISYYPSYSQDATGDNVNQPGGEPVENREVPDSGVNKTPDDEAPRERVRRNMPTTPMEPADKSGTKKMEVPKVTGKTTKYFTLNFKDVEIAEFLNVMSQLIKKNILVDDRVRGKITISSAKKIPVDQAYDILKSILEVKGFAVVETDNLIKVIPIKDAIKKNVEIIIDSKKDPKTPKDEDKAITFMLEVEHADATEVSNALRSLKSANTDIIVYLPLNTIIFSGTSSEINGLVRIARALDKKLEELKDQKISKGNIHVVHLENADAEQLASVLARIPFSETALIDNSPLQLQQQVPVQQQTPPVQRSDKTSRVTRSQQTAPPTKSQQKLSIIANKDTNSLIITANPEEFKEILRIIRELDIVREQVLIEALIVEISADNSWGFGIDWMLGNQSGIHMYGGSSLMGSAPSNYTTSYGGKQLALPLAPGVMQLGYMADRSVLGFALLNASGTDKNFNVLSTPQILTIDNQEAELNVGEEVAFQSNSRISDTGVTFWTYEYKSVGVKLKITPHITKQSRITLDLYQEVNSLLTQPVYGSSNATPPKIGKRDIKTKVTVEDGKTIVVGGLIRNNKSVEEIKVPVLGDIPLLGWFFKRKSVGYSKTNLLVFITPHVVTKQDRLDAITQQKKEEQRRVNSK
jgi:general secretion pathway protein D